MSRQLARMINEHAIMDFLMHTLEKGLMFTVDGENLYTPNDVYQEYLEKKYSGEKKAQSDEG